MILTITLNPSVDISYKLDHFSIDNVNRVRDVSKTAGGKGLNVTRVLKQLGEEAAATGFLGGSLGDFIRSELSDLGIHDYFIGIKEETRNCIAVIHEGKQTEILEAGPTVTENEAVEFLDRLAEYVKKVDLVTISGSLPKGLADNFYNKIMEIAGSKNTPVLLDTKGELLGKTLEGKVKPFLIKPNQDELADLLGEQLNDQKRIIDALRLPIFADVNWVVVTTGAKGAMIKQGSHFYRAMAPEINAVNPVGSGDSVIAGFAAGLKRGLTDEELIRFGLAMGVLNAMEEKTGHINTAKIDWCMKQIEVEELS
ncbi:1-phosphofructokinase [Virgibacillus dakarensis]|uniref:1-phosphofructokinase n=1 Tax=Virgibacillus dakarensis TaxID=1917889 RepID=UPI000B454749|nr:1-phosphofructokinase [Virgibacillus dakarensis]MBT2215994.1 1-phosphofructokinase [Virgibacillus dakarensis]